MKRFILLITVSLLLLSTSVVLAMGEVIFSNTYNKWGTYYSSTDSDDGFRYQSFADFSCDRTIEITDFHWWGWPLGEYGIRDFTFQIWSNDFVNNMPGDLLYEETFADANAAPVDDPEDTWTYFYSIDLSTPFITTASNYYWFSVYAYSNGSWYWATGYNDLWNPDWQFGHNYNEWDEIRPDFAYEVTGAVIPEPVTLILIGLGLLGMSVRRRK